MEIRQLAETLLFGSELEEKLTTPKTPLTDEDRGSPICVPHSPHRSQSISLGGAASHTSSLGASSLGASSLGASSSFPKPHELGDEQKRATILHFFFNHELLAVELMALALLRFPDCDKNFRRGIVQTIKEEQQHMKLYLNRMNELGVELGSVRLNDFFWRAMKDMKNPMEYVTQMSLTFEQANLDFSIYYRDLIEKLGDSKTATLLHQVFIDELSHVKFGFRWFQKWSDPELSCWQNYCENLNFPITPARAKGTYFNKSVREKIGFSKEYIDQLEVFSQSKGRAPNIYLFNPDCEIDYEKTLRQKSCRFIEKKQTQKKLMDDLEVSPLFYAKADDVVLVKKSPSFSFLKSLKDAGVDLPEFHTYNDNLLKTLETISKERKIHQFRPWGWTPHLKTSYDKKNLPPSIEGSVDDLREVFSKVWSVKICRHFLEHSQNSIWSSPQTVGDVYEKIEDIETAIKKHIKKNDLQFGLKTQPLVLKCPYGLSGNGQKVLKSFNDWSLIKPWVEKKLKLQEHIILEPWLDKIFDFSVQLDIQKNRPVFKGLARFLTDSQGRYLGALINHFSGFVDNQTKAFIYSKDQNFKKAVEELSEFVHKKMREKKYCGPVGVDCLAYKISSKDDFTNDFIGANICIKPLVEINPRYNMGRITVEMASYLKKESVGVWLIEHKNSVHKKGFKSLMDFNEAMTKRFPLKVNQQSHPPFVRKIISGYLLTSNLDQNSSFLSFLFVGKNEKELKPVTPATAHRRAFAIF